MKVPYRFRRAAALLLGCSLLLTGHLSVAAEPDTPCLQVASVDSAGWVATVPVTLTDHPGLAALKLELIYDTDALSLVQISNGTLFDSLTADRYVVLDSAADVTADGTLFTLKFNISSQAEADSYTIGIAVCEAFNAAEQDCTVNAASGIITVKRPVFMYGDATGDSNVDSKDVVRLRKYIAAYDYATGTSTVAVEPGADATGDGKIDSKDVVRLRKYIAAYDYATGTSTVKLGPDK